MRIKARGVSDGAHPTHRRRKDDVQISRDYFCAYDELESFLCHMIGTTVMYDDPISGTKKLSRLLPQAYPNKPQVCCVGLEEATGFQHATPYLSTDDVPVYTFWDSHLLFQHCPFTLGSDAETDSEHKRYVIELPSQVGADYVTLPGGILKFQREGGGGASGKPIPYNVGFAMPNTTVSRKWLQIPYAAWQEGSILRSRVMGNIEDGVEPWLGTINNQTIFGNAPGQLLLIGAEDQLVFDTLGNELFFEITYKWLKKGVNHNWFKFFDPDGPNTGWYFVSNDGNYYDSVDLPDGKSLFNARDHKGLFAVGTYP